MRRDDAHASDDGLMTDLPAQAPPGHRLVVLDLGCRGLDDRSAAAVAADVGPGGILAVLTHSHRSSGRLIDSSGAVITALQDADLLYLQHIVIVKHPLSPRPEPAQQAIPHNTADATDDAAHRARTRPGRSHAFSPTRLPAANPRPRTELPREPRPTLPRRPTRIREHRDDLPRARPCGKLAAPTRVLRRCAAGPAPHRGRRPVPVTGRIWLTGQQPSRTQHARRYTPESMAHPAKMMPTVAAHAIAIYTGPASWVCDPMCGIGTTLVEALRAGRPALGVEYEPRWAALARANLALAAADGHTSPGPGDHRRRPPPHPARPHRICAARWRW